MVKEKMNYTIQKSDEFLLIGQEIELTRFQSKNIQISIKFWRKFNSNLKKSYLSQAGNWIKFAVMVKREEKLFYYCSVPKKIEVPDGFIQKEMKSHKYLVVEHVGAMDKIYDTYREIYQNILPNSQYILAQDEFLHFEKYDHRFHWNGETSVIEIWIPIHEEKNPNLCE